MHVKEEDILGGLLCRLGAEGNGNFRADGGELGLAVHLANARQDDDSRAMVHELIPRDSLRLLAFAFVFATTGERIFDATHGLKYGGQRDDGDDGRTLAIWAAHDILYDQYRQGRVTLEVRGTVGICRGTLDAAFHRNQLETIGERRKLQLAKLYGIRIVTRAVVAIAAAIELYRMNDHVGVDNSRDVRGIQDVASVVVVLHVLAVSIFVLETSS